MKRIFDLIIACVGIVLLIPLFLVGALLIMVDSEGPAFFRQERVGRNFVPFDVYKFRTMFRDAPQRGGQITVGDDPRITRVGRYLRRTKIDELPQLINVLVGDMSLVGPRPEVAKYVERYREDYEEILKYRPGITDLASLKYRNEADVLVMFEDPEEHYVEEIITDKIRLAKQYCRDNYFIMDLQIIFKTFLRVLRC